MLLRTSFLILVALAFAPGAARAAESYDNCTGYIDSVPAIISTQGTWCLRKDLATAITSGRAIEVATNNVTIDCNGFKLGNLEAGDSTLARGIYASGKLGVTARNCNVRGFWIGISLGVAGGAYRIEDNRIQGATYIGIHVDGDGSIVRGNTVNGISGTTDFALGINANGAVDLLDNTVVGISNMYNVHGIRTQNNAGGRVAGNRVSDLVSSYGGDVYGIQELNSTGMSLRDNHISGPAGLTGLACASDAARAQGNTISGFATGITGCGDAGLNDVSP